MCGIFAYLNHLTPRTRQQILATLVCALKTLENKGYDSAGIAITGSEGNSIEIVKKAGSLFLLEEAIYAFVVVHNGIITNYKELSTFLSTKGMQMETETDTEVIVKLMLHLFQQHEHKPSFYELVQTVLTHLEGAFALVFKSVHYPEEVVVSCKGSPMMVGVRSDSKLATDHVPVLCSKDVRGLSSSAAPTNGVWTLAACEAGAGVEFFVSSDASAVIEFTKRVIYLQDNDVACIADGQLTIHKVDAHRLGSRERDRSEGGSREVSLLQHQIHQISKGSFTSYMEKEIHEQVESVMNTMRGRVNFETHQVTLGGIKAYVSEIGRCRRLLVIACATSYHAAVATRQLIEELTELSVMVDLASDFIDRTTPVFRDDVCIFLSQSGETADTLQALRHCKERGALIVGITNTVGSSVCRQSHCGIHANAGPEIGVASTKAYTSQFISLVLFSLVMCQDRICLQGRRRQIIEALKLLPGQIRGVLERSGEVRQVALRLQHEESLLFVARGYNYATCLEGALKIKELTYMHSEAINAGELKHGPLALVDQQMPIIAIVTKDAVYRKSLNALQQITARHGKPIVVCTEGDAEVIGMADQAFQVPVQVDCLQGVLAIIPLQLLALHIAQLKRFNVDQPRSLLKHHSEGN